MNNKTQDETWHSISNTDLNEPTNEWLGAPWMHEDVERITSKCSIVIDSTLEHNWWVELNAKEIWEWVEWYTRMSEWIRSSRFIPYFQWIRDNKDWKIKKFESLIRYIDDWGKVLSPQYFIEKAREYWQIKEMMLSLFAQILEKMKENDFLFSINLSLEDLSDKHFINTLMTQFTASWLDSKRFIIEILEDKYEWDDNIVRENILTLKDYWFVIALDDFWSEYNNFDRALKFWPDIIKIDWAFIKDIHKSDESKKIVKYFVEFANSIWAETIAECVETEEIQKIIDELWVDFTQWYLFSKPNKHVITD